MNWEQFKQHILSNVPLQQGNDYVKIEARSSALEEVVLQCRPTKIIFPLREGELIEDLSTFSTDVEYALTYPGTASTKCIVIYQNDYNFFLGGIPSYEYTRISLRRVDATTFQLTLVSKEHEYFLIPFDQRWQDAADRYKGLLGGESQAVAPRTPRFLVQLGVKDPYGNVHIKDFEELLPVIARIRDYFGAGHLVHFFGTNQAGFDRMFPDYTIDPELGGEKALSELIAYAKSLNLLTSHHYNPRIADADWVERHRSYERAMVHRNGEAVTERYKDHPHYVMNLNDPEWFARCFETIHYLADLGFDYLEIDQFTYQRNFYHADQPLAQGYKHMVDEFIRLGYRFWLEGVSDIFRVPSGNFYQILIRDRAQLWDDGENRRGYPYGRTFAEFFMYLWPDSEVSYQLFTENKSFDRLEERMTQARAIHAAVYDLELGFYDQDYLSNLNLLAQRLGLHEAS